MDRPPTRYADTGEVTVAYCRGGGAAPDLVVMPGFATHIELMWEPPFGGRLFDRLSRFARVTQIDKRGVGLSDRIAEPATLEQRMDDLRVVMDAEGIERAAILGISDGASMSALFAATYPERVSSLVLWEGGAGPPPEPALRDVLLPFVQDNWGTGAVMATLLRVEAADIEGLARLERYAMSPRMARALLEMDFTNDIRGALPVISAPTLVVHRTGDPILGRDRAVALGDLIPGARRVELPGNWHLSLVDDEEAEVLDAIEEFITGSRPAPGIEADRVLATVLFTDIVDSTPRAAALGDRRWSALLDAHDRAVATEIDRHRGTMVRSTGDGVLARFDGPVRGIRCARAIVDAADRLDLRVRAGLHAGEFLLRGDDVAGLTVHIGARISALAGPGEVYLSSSVRDLVAGSGISFDGRGRHVLKGVPGEWDVFAVAAG
ncbi:MAG TPA: adenylate/guanylate cyclase domain-containing protein [Acidimicrobiales bacterium]|nr:adenylate/guanylate cyclase domain-containing protein [Acidimicrobiales bacterium]